MAGTGPRADAARSGPADLALAVACGAAAMAVYVRTLAPGLTADVDTALFQFVGRVLGVGHNPGYPFYVLLTHPYSYLPIGTLAYRMNLFSGLMGAVAVALTCAVSRRLGVRRGLAATAALGLAFSPVFWSQSLIAEVYTLHAALVAGIVLLLLVWAATRRSGWYYGAVAVFAAGLGNHTTILALLPGMAGFVWLTDRRFARGARTLLVTAGLLAAGLLQYGFILLRSLAPDAYVESKATTVPALVRVMLGRQFQDRLFTFTWHAVLFERLPAAVQGVFAPALTIPGLLLATAGMAWLVRRRVPEAVLLLPAALAVLVFALDYAVLDTPVFLIPVVLVLWLCAGVGAETGARLAGRIRVPAVAVTCAVALIPAWLLASNLRDLDRSRDVEVPRTVTPLFRVLPDHAALVSEDFIADRVMSYERFGEGAAAARGISQLPRDAAVVWKRVADGTPVFALPKAAGALRFQALDVAFRPLRLVGGTLDEFLDTLPDGATVAIAVPGSVGDAFAASPGGTLRAIGVPLATSQAGASVAVIGVRGARGGAAVQRGHGPQRCRAGADQPIGATGSEAPVPIAAEADGRAATIREGSREILHTSEGVAVAVWSRTGSRLHALVLEPADGFRVPVPAGPLSAHRVRGRCTGGPLDGTRWTDVTARLSTGTALLRAPLGATMVLYVADDARLAPRVFDNSDRGRVSIAPFEGQAARASLQAAVRKDGAGTSIDGAHVYRIALSASEGVPVSVLMAFGGVPARAVARVIDAGQGPGRVEIFRVPTDGLLREPDRATEELGMSRDLQSQLTGAGWSRVDADAAGPYRWIVGTEARVLLPTTHAHATRVRVQVLSEPADITRQLALRINGTPLASQTLQPGWHVYGWDLPPGALVQGANEISLRLDPPPLDAGSADEPHRVAVSDVRLVGSTQ